MTTLDDLLRRLAPALDPIAYRFEAVGEAPPVLTEAVRMAFREAEGWTVVVAVEAGEAPPLFRRIVLTVVSDLEDAGLTAAVSGVLADRGIAVNVVAAYHHDHLFVPAERAEDALKALEGLMTGSAERR